jgi:acetyl esterase/lipase
LRQISAVLPAEQAWSVWVSRQIVARIMDFSGPSLAGTEVEALDVTLPDKRRVVGEWVRARGVHRTDAAIYFVHGSGYVLCSPRTHRRLTSWLSALTGLPVFSIDYRVAPKYRFPAAAEDVAAGWDWMLTPGGLTPERIVVAGDSAGGHLLVDLMLQSASARQASATVLMSP